MLFFFVDAALTGSKNRAYPFEFKLRVIEEAKRTSNRKAARVFGVNEKCIRNWRLQEAELRQTLDIEQELSSNTKRRYRLGGAGRKPQQLLDNFAFVDIEIKENDP